ncbi:glycoprotein 3-alpha-L-fucosyltransferase A-like [Macrobrachium nipponense]|uniref:glycoprotein 3-alpha-L-fucosyltransferase A-like n=1 Tax=Macrobrachium nipponense TaxID=159736 RepID=UPI0030C84B88
MVFWRSLGRNAAQLLHAIQLRKSWSHIIAILIICFLISILSGYTHLSLRSDEKRGFALSEIIASRFFEVGKQSLKPHVTEELIMSIKDGVTTSRLLIPELQSNVQEEGDSLKDGVAKVTEAIFHRLNGSRQLHKKPSSTHIDNWHNFTRSEIDSLSIVGRRLFLQEDVGIPQDRNFTILVWKHGPYFETRFLKEYGDVYLDPFRFCSVRNCEITYDSSFLDTADAVLFHCHRTSGPAGYPNRTNFGQRWVWLADECPYHTFNYARDKNISHYNGYFNWSMTYRKDSDVPVPYGRTVRMTNAEASQYERVDYFNSKINFTAAMGTNCGGGNKRWHYVRELKKHMNVDFYGGCGTLKCPRHAARDCKLLKSYKFYLAFENNDCREYITEKVWLNAMKNGAVPVVMGGKAADYRKLLPPNSFIHIDDFQSPKQLANYLSSLAQDAAKYMEYHAWRSKFRVLNEHGYFGAPVFHYCRLCEALNYNDPAPKVYNHMEVFWSKETDCYQPTWIDRMNANST